MSRPSQLYVSWLKVAHGAHENNKILESFVNKINYVIEESKRLLRCYTFKIFGHVFGVSIKTKAVKIVAYYVVQRFCSREIVIFNRHRSPQPAWIRSQGFNNIQMEMSNQ